MMKKVFGFAVNSIILFWSYFLSSSLWLLFAQTFMRIFIAADSKGEYLWKSFCMYAWILLTCVIHLVATATTHKPKYLTYMTGKEWKLKEAVIYTVKNFDFWYNTIGFAIWPVILPKLFGAINRLFVSIEFYNTFPLSILSIATVSVPIILFSLVGWLLVLKYWYKKRLHVDK